MESDPYLANSALAYKAYFQLLIMVVSLRCGLDYCHSGVNCGVTSEYQLSSSVTFQIGVINQTQTVIVSGATSLIRVLDVFKIFIHITCQHFRLFLAHNLVVASTISSPSWQGNHKEPGITVPVRSISAYKYRCDC